MKLSERVADLTRPTGEEDLLAVHYPKPRFMISPRHGMWVALVCVIGLAAWFFLRQPTSPGYSYAPASVSAAPTSETMAVVSVVGAVSAPGLVTLTPGARIDDALQAAQPLPEADLASLNLAEKLSDGKQIQVPVVGAAPVQAASEPGKVSLNSATAAELESLDGVGTKTAAAIIAHREQIGGFSAIEQLQEVKGIGPAKFAAISPEVTL
ncbi:ComEA family DNA-binding protein [Corynebacterium sp. H128]|uniref:ComEA family DNA-binding protein n=1 Tax=Corynebacterium sp. H128 TaxID=3133427 RepID=UPI00309B444E